MSKKEELQAKRDELQKHSLETVERLSQLDIEIEALLAEESKPKLRHGDYGTSEYGNCPRLYIRDKDGMNWCSGEELKYGLTGNGTDNTILGNIFDDLTALQEDVESFEIKASFSQNRIKVTYDKKHIRIADREEGDYVPIAVENFSELVLKFRQMHATQMRQEAKQ